MFWKHDDNILTWLPRLQCHRGCWITGKQQNSLDSIKEAFRKKFKMVEFDVRLTRDRVVILFHDDAYKGKRIEHYSFQELKGETVNEYPHINTLSEVFDWYASEIKSDSQDSFKLNIELKSKKIVSFDLEKNVNRLINQYQMKSKILVSSFNPFSLAYFRFFNKNIFRAILVSLEENTDNHWLLKKMYLNFLCSPHVLHLRVTDWDRSKFKKVKVPIVLWTLNDISLYQEIKEQIWGVISDKITPEQIAD